ncbi:Retrovirus-related Pol polyprotein from transposon opus [Thelohanellus kitauei]|uniref:Retrovirus-related Pol polyprotein from transposon opus n=1 Tax=Thelohanellus kitauei TaxID=669202 RepID=A0A0C2IU28_THEKT|nr:Retrovirus-related Pol polyprotein from transposon opus [Thelohanellus kitauei]
MHTNKVAIKESDRSKTSFATPSGLFQFRAMPFGLCNALATFQNLMNIVLKKYIGQSCYVYIDDIIIYNDSFEDHCQHLEMIISTLISAGLCKYRPPKSKIFCTSIKFLGNIVSQNGIRTDPMKVQAITNWPPPKSKHELQQFLGLCSYYRRYFPNFANHVSYLYKLIKNDAEWSAVLSFPDMQKKFILDIDENNSALNAVLSQKNGKSQQVIAYTSRSLSKAEKNYGTTKKEM